MRIAAALIFAGLGLAGCATPCADAITTATTRQFDCADGSQLMVTFNPSPPSGQQSLYHENGQWWLDDGPCGTQGEPCRFGVTWIHFDERLRQVGAKPGTQSGARHGVPLVAHPSGVEPQRKLRGRCFA